jgi:hypothetical protein
MIVQSLMFSWSSFHQESDSLANMIQTVPESSTAVIMTRTVTLATYDHGDERANKILVSGKVWVVLGAFTALLFGSSVLFPPDSAPLAFGASVLVLGAALVAICYAKGEPPRWRWGSK